MNLMSKKSSTNSCCERYDRPSLSLAISDPWIMDGLGTPQEAFDSMQQFKIGKKDRQSLVRRLKIVHI